MGKLLNMLRGAVPAPRTEPQWRPAPGAEVPIKIVGEASYQPHIATVSKRHGGELQLVLRADPGNQYDPNAVVVLVDGGVVGYLPRELARQWQPRILAAESEGYLVTGSARVYGGTSDKPSMGVFGSAVWPGGGRAPKA